MPDDQKLNVKDAVSVARQLGTLLRSPVLAQIEPLANTLASIAGHVDELKAEIPKLEDQRATLRSDIAAALTQADTVKRDADNEVRRRTADCEATCAKMTVKAQEEVQLLEEQKSKVIAAQKDEALVISARIDELTATKKALESEILAHETKHSDAKAKLKELLS